MANKSISQLTAATTVNNADLFVLEQNGVAKKLTGDLLLATIGAHGGITSTSYTAPVSPSLQGTLTLTYADGTSTDIPIYNGAKGDTGASGYSPSATVEKVGHTTTITITDSNQTTYASIEDGHDGVDGADGNPGYCWIKFASVEPTSDSDMGDIPDEWMGVYSGSSAAAPTSYTSYAWYKIKGAQGYRGATGAPGADGTMIYLSNAAPLLYDGYYYFDSGFLVSPSRQIGVSPARGDLVLYRNSLYSATGLTDMVRGERCVWGYDIVINTATDEQVQDAVDEYLANHPTATGTFSNAAKNALLALLEKVAYIDGDGQTYLDALRTELFRINVNSISAVFTQGSAVIYDTDPLDTLKQYLVVTATYSDSTTEVLTDSVYTLSGTLTVGTSTITVSYGGKTATFDVTVSDFMLNDILTLDGIQNTRSGHDASATTWEDLSGNNNDFVKGSNASDILWGADCAKFDATNRRLVNTSGIISNLSAMTIEIVAKINGNGSFESSGNYFGGVVNNGYVANPATGFRIYTYNNTGFSSRYESTSLGYVSLAQETHYICYVVNGTTCQKYVDGIATGDPVSITFSADTKPADVYLGLYEVSGSGAGFPNMDIYRLGISSSALTVEEIGERFQMYKTRFGIEDGGE